MRITLVLSLVLMCGCGGNDGPTLYDASGIVTYKGEPLPNASIIMTPTSTGPVVIGTSDENGKFTLMTSGKPGAIEGSYQVAITAVEAGPQSSLSPEEMQAQYEKEGKMPVVETKSLIPAKYSLPRNSGLTATVTPEGPNEFKFELKDE